jgi:hypothetical protein
MDQARGLERGLHPCLGWGFPQDQGSWTGEGDRRGGGRRGLTAALSSLHAAGIEVLVIEAAGSAAELAAFDHAYRSTTLPDVAALNSRPSLTP